MSIALKSCAACSAALPETAAFCGECGFDQAQAKPDGPENQARIPKQVLLEDILTPPQSESEPQASSRTAGPDESERRTARAATKRPSGRTVALAATAVIGVLAVTGFGLRAAGIGTGPSDAEQKAAALKAHQAQLTPRLDTFMSSRASFFAAERKYLPAMKDAKAEIAAYTKKAKAVAVETKQLEAAYAPQFAECATYLYVSCPDPDYPDSPDAPELDSQISQLRSVSRNMNSLHAQLVGVQPPTELEPAYAQLTAAVDSLGDNAKENARILDEGITPPDGSNGEGYVDQTKLKALNGNDALPSIKLMNQTLVATLKSAQLPVGRYDLPGGQDADPDDHSTSL